MTNKTKETNKTLEMQHDKNQTDPEAKSKKMTDDLEENPFLNNEAPTDVVDNKVPVNLEEWWTQHPDGSQDVALDSRCKLQSS